MAAGDGFSSPDLLALAARFQALASGDLTGLLAAANEEIVVGSYDIARSVYTPKLGDLWRITATTGTLPDGMLAQIHFDGSDYRLIGYEFGTRQHRIPTGGVAKPPLYFEWLGGMVVFAHVENPGEKPHDRLPEMEAQVTSLASYIWETALIVALEGGLMG